ncbi:MAG: type IV toxin-antitoxin system AbiEi family antitoxin domain-containing protein [Streptosporangiaceae bacterium]
MGSLLEELERREAEARAEAGELRGRIAELAERLAGVEERLARLVVTRETVDEVLAAPGQGPSPVPAAVRVPAGSGRSPVIGVVKVPAWRAGLDVSVLPRDYRDLLEVAQDAGRPVRAAQIAAAAGLSTQRGKVETLRGKLRRLVERGWLAGDAGPGLFALPRRDRDAGEQD